MITISISQLKNDIQQMMKGTSLNEIQDFEGMAGKAAARMLARISPEETRRTAVLATPFWDNVNDYALASDYKQMIDIRPTAFPNRQNMPGQSDWGQTTPKQFNIRLNGNSFSIRWNNFVRTLRAQVLPSGQVQQMDSFDVFVTGLNAVSNGTWTAEGDASGLYNEPLNFVEGQASMGMNLSGSTGLADVVNSTAAAANMVAMNNENTSFIFFYIPVGYSSRFTSFTLRRGSDASNYYSQTATTKMDGTAFTDGWNFLMFNWGTASTTGTPDNTLNTYRRFGINYTAGAAINGCLLDNWTDSLGTLYEIEYYSEFLFRTSAGSWLAVPTADTDLVNVSPTSYEILKTEMMIDITQIIRTGNTRVTELADWRQMLNGQPQSRYVKDPPYHGLYADYLAMFPSSAIRTITSYYNFDL